jgi:hypothetical protein
MWAITQYFKSCIWTILRQLRVWLRQEVQAICNSPCSYSRTSSCHWRLSHQPSGESVCGIRWVPLSVHGNLLLCNYVVRLATLPAHPWYTALFHPSFRYRFEFLTLAPRPVAVRLHHLIQQLGMQLPYFILHRLPPVWLWDISHPSCDVTYHIRYRRNVSFHVP